MSAVAECPEAVDTLSAWLTAYLAAPETAAKEFFTAHELLAAAGMPYSHENLSAMARAAGSSGLTQARRRVDGAVLRAWNRPSRAFLAQQAAERLDRQEAQARQRVRDYIDCAAEWALMSHRVQTRDTRARMDEALARHRRTAKAILHRLDPCASSDPAPRVLDFEEFMQHQTAVIARAFGVPRSLLTPPPRTAADADRRARPRGARP